MIAADHTLHNAATAHTSAVLRLVDVLRASRAAQWEKSPGASDQRPPGIADPVGELAVTETRLALRSAVDDALARLGAATGDLDALAISLEAALERHSIPASHGIAAL